MQSDEYRMMRIWWTFFTWRIGSQTYLNYTKLQGINGKEVTGKIKSNKNGEEQERNRPQKNNINMEKKTMRKLKG